MEKMERDKEKTIVKQCDGFYIITFWKDEIPKVSSAGWHHKVIEGTWIPENIINKNY